MSRLYEGSGWYGTITERRATVVRSRCGQRQSRGAQLFDGRAAIAAARRTDTAEPSGRCRRNGSRRYRHRNRRDPLYRDCRSACSWQPLFLLLSHDTAICGMAFTVAVTFGPALEMRPRIPGNITHISGCHQMGGKPMIRMFWAIVICLGLAPIASAQERIGAVSTTFHLTSPNDKVLVERFDDAEVEGVSCYVSRAETGGWKGAVGLAEDPSRFSIACRAVGVPKVVGKIAEGEDGEVVFSERTSAIFKTLRITRFLDKKKNVLVYLAWSTKIVEGSPYNSVSVVPLDR